MPTCGNALLNSNEECDDGGAISGDGCSASCVNEPGYLCTLPGLACSPFDLFIDTPVHGIFTTASSIMVTGHYSTLLPGQVAVTVNGVRLSSSSLVPAAASAVAPSSRIS